MPRCAPTRTGCKLNAALPTPRPTVSVVRVLANNLRYYQRANYSGTLLTDLGFPRPASQNVDDFALLNQSLETLGPMGDADVIVVCADRGEQMGLLQARCSDSPLWQNLGAVKQRQRADRPRRCLDGGDRLPRRRTDLPGHRKVLQGLRLARVSVARS